MGKYNPREVIEIAIEMERQGQAFYTELMKSATTADVKAILAHMIDQEAGHETEFKKLFDSLTGSIEEYNYGLDEQAELFFEAIARTQVFKSLEQAREAAVKIRDFKDAVNYAIDQELKTIAFYEGLRAALGQAPGTEKIEALIREERGHVTRLYQMRECRE